MNSLKIVFRLLKHMRPYWWRLMVLVVLSLLGVVFMVSKPLPIKDIIDNVLLKKDLPQFVSVFMENCGMSQEVDQLLFYPGIYGYCGNWRRNFKLYLFPFGKSDWLKIDL